MPKLIISNSFNPWFNLALEENLFDTLLENEIILYLWQNDNTVVIGRNQNAWKECKWKKLENDNGKLARRLSGGGAVYHDLGNLNFTFIMSNKFYNLEKQHTVLINAVKSFGISAYFSGRNDMLINEKKFSGHAYYYRDNKAYHHGTLLVNSDLDKLTYYLNPSIKKIQSKGVDSVRARVCNICEFNNDIKIETLKNSLIDCFVNTYGSLNETKTYDENNIEINDLYQKYSSWDWRYGKSPNFDISYSERFDWGEIDLNFKLQNGIITDCTIYTDAMEENIFDDLKSMMVGQKLQKDCIIKQINTIQSKTESSTQVLSDLCNWIKKLEI